MTKEEVFEGLKEIFATIKPKLDLDKVTMDSKLVMDLGVDSLSMLLLSLAAEQKFGMQFQPMSKPFETVGEVCDYILSAVA
jgi:acyl carrier protein